MISGLPCKEDAIELLNRSGKKILGLGDVECPQRIKNFKGILGEIDSVTAMKYMERNGLLVNRELDLSVDFSTPFVIAHEPPFGVGTGYILDISIGSRGLRAKVLSNLFRINTLFHGHSEIQIEVNFHGVKIVSIGLGSNKQLVEYRGEGKYSFISLDELVR
ncbi:hypothetical protein [Metallosphaera hakonensis]|uniref:Metallophosphoesterase TT1561-like domain-containing protein n=1 Tax=Metallosphaera hakonensis JCM 8857 = DSM 7519 TaxID=1293036 RepID=A0A2U9ITX7_9CREN|nr:hypothetical protein [Metallosphaera hakonensis]AWR99377.1 hypothetical protein DFR87_06290 [Metallosphaera hakonensis JCM 8857 = DSM 7519]